MATDHPDSPLVEVPDPRPAMSAAEARVYILEHPEMQVTFSAQVWLRWVDLLEEAFGALVSIPGYGPLCAKIDRATNTTIRVGVPSITIKAG